jgi:hypothetical protein
MFSSDSAPSRVVVVVFALATLATWGCSDLDTLEGGDVAPPDSGPPPDGCQADQFDLDGECYGPVPEDAEEVCAFVDTLPTACTDVDGDCYVFACERTLPAALFRAIEDCDDGRPDVFPNAPEVCDVRDNDCDLQTDEAFPEIGAFCEACGGGKLECAVGDDTRLACSTLPGQSQDPDLSEICDGLDDDCDGTVDEGCRVPLGDAGRLADPVICDDRIILVADGALIAVPLDGRPAEGAERVTPDVVDPSENARYPACGEGGIAWLEVDGACEGDPVSCLATVYARSREAEAPVALTGRGLAGPPIVHDAQVYWHSEARMESGVRRFIQRAALDGVGGIEPVGGGLDVSDPEVSTAGDLAWRVWSDERVQVDVTLSGGDLLTLSGPSTPGAPRLGDGWAVWATGAPPGLWVVPLSNRGRGGFQLTGSAAPQYAPRASGRRVVWLDEGTSPPALRALDLATGARVLVARAPITPGAYALRDDVVVWVAEDAAGEPALFRHALAPLSEVE